MSAAQNRGPELMAIQSVFLVAAWVATGLRAYVKLAITRDHTVDDGVMYLSTLLYSAYAAAALVGIIKGGIGRHTSDLDSDSIVVALQIWYTCEILFAFISALVRTSICLFMLRVFTHGMPRIILRGAIVTVWISSIVYLFIIVFQCNPPRYYWAQFEGASGSCRPASLVPNATIVHSVVAAFSDWIIGILPLSKLWKLQMPRAKKMPLVFFFGVGTIAGMIMIVRIPYLKVLEISADFLYQTV
ncbi:hypothetical protein CGCFRS4_v015437 [Colletotrichum fructicola]|nr:hypothetical protein CGCFRS4_v015437 [Colletotrichum fructicola]